MEFRDLIVVALVAVVPLGLGAVAALAFMGRIR